MLGTDSTNVSVIQPLPSKLKKKSGEKASMFVMGGSRCMYKDLFVGIGLELNTAIVRVVHFQR